MPYCIWVTRASSYVAAHRGDATGALDAAEIEDLLAILEADWHAADRSFRLHHPSGKDPWCSVFPHPERKSIHHLEFSASFGHPSFPRNMADMFDLALRFAKRLGGRVFEEQKGVEVTPANVDALLEPNGAFAQGLIKFWQAGRASSSR